MRGTYRCMARAETHAAVGIPTKLATTSHMGCGNCITCMIAPRSTSAPTTMAMNKDRPGAMSEPAITPAAVPPTQAMSTDISDPIGSDAAYEASACESLTSGIAGPPDTVCPTVSTSMIVAMAVTMPVTAPSIRRMEGVSMRVNTKKNRQMFHADHLAVEKSYAVGRLSTCPCHRREALAQPFPFQDAQRLLLLL